jgi:hypothetical protein
LPKDWQLHPGDWEEYLTMVFFALCPVINTALAILALQALWEDG